MQPMRVTSDLPTRVSQGLPVALHCGGDFAGYGAHTRRQAFRGLASIDLHTSRPAGSSIGFRTFLSILENHLWVNAISTTWQKSG